MSLQTYHWQSQGIYVATLIYSYTQNFSLSCIMSTDSILAKYFYRLLYYLQVCMHAVLILLKLYYHLKATTYILNDFIQLVINHILFALIYLCPVTIATPDLIGD